MIKHIATINNNALLQKDNFLFVVYDYHLDLNMDLSWMTNVEDDVEVEAKIELLPDGKIKVHHFQELYQFNCCRGLLDIIKLIQLVTKENIDLSAPEKFQVTNFTNGKFKISSDKFKANFSFTYKGINLTGDGTFIKYWFFYGLEEVVTSVQDLMNLYVGLTKLTAKACHEADDDMFLQCDEWIAVRDDNYKKNGTKLYSLRPGII